MPETRILIAVAIILCLLVLGMVLARSVIRRQRFQRLRRRGIKTHGH